MIEKQDEHFDQLINQQLMRSEYKSESQLEIEVDDQFMSGD